MGKRKKKNIQTKTVQCSVCKAEDFKLAPSNLVSQWRDMSKSGDRLLELLRWFRADLLSSSTETINLHLITFLRWKTGYQQQISANIKFPVPKTADIKWIRGDPGLSPVGHHRKRKKKGFSRKTCRKAENLLVEVKTKCFPDGFDQSRAKRRSLGRSVPSQGPLKLCICSYRQEMSSAPTVLFDVAFPVIWFLLLILL